MDRLAELNIFVEVIQRGDYSAVARALGMTPSAVSKAIKRLEMRLGARLLDRTSRMMQPTADGSVLYSNALRALEAVETAESSVSGSLTKATGDLTIQVPPTFAIYQIARVMPEFRELYPNIRVAFVLANEPLDMAEHRIDATVVIGAPPDSELMIRKIASSGWVICASPEYLERRGHPATLEDLKQHDCLGYVLSATSPPSTRRMGLESSTLLLEGTNVSANNGSMLQALARVGMGIVRLAEYHVAADLAAGRLVRLRLDNDSDREDVYAVYPRKLKDSHRLRVFLDFLRERFSAPDWGSRDLEPKVRSHPPYSAVGMS